MDYLHAHMAGWGEGTEGDTSSLAGLWLATGVSRDDGTMEDGWYDDWQTIEELRLLAISKRGTSWSAISTPGMWFMLEMRADGRFREVDLSQYPLKSLGKRKPIESVGMVYRDGGGGFEHSFEGDEDGFVRCHEPKGALGDSSRVVLTFNRPDELVTDVIKLNEDGQRPRAWHSWSGMGSTRPKSTSTTPG